MTTQRWLTEAKAKLSKVGWFKDKSFEILKSQKYLDLNEPVLVQEVFLSLPFEITTNSTHDAIVRFSPKIASETLYTITSSDENICKYDQENNKLEFYDVAGEVDLTVTMVEGDASVIKTVNVIKLSDGVEIVESNVFIKDEEKIFTVALTPFDSTEKIELVESFTDSKEIKIAVVDDELNQYKLLANTLGTYTLKIKTNYNTYKYNIYVVDSEDEVVNKITLPLADIYDFKDSLFIQPVFEPNTATKKDYILTLNNYDIVSYFSGRNQISTFEQEGDIEVKIKMLVGGASDTFNFKVRKGAKPDPVVTGITINGLPEVLTVGDINNFTVDIEPEGFTNDDVIITVTGCIELNGTSIKAVSSGVGTLKVSSKSGNVFDTKTFTINEPVYLVDGINVTGVPTSILADGNVSTFNYTVSPSNATNKNVDVTVTGNLILNTAKTGISSNTVGSGTVVFKSKDGSNITVTKNVSINPVLVSSVAINSVPATVTYDDLSKSFAIVVSPSNATNKTYTLTSSANIVITGNTFKTVGDGTATITATANDASKSTKTSTFNIVRPNISSIDFVGLSTNLKVGGKSTFTVNVAPKYAIEDITYTTNDVLSVNQTTKEVTALKLGTGVLTATSNDSGKVVKTANVSVTPTLVSKLTINGLPTTVVRGQEYTYSVAVEPSDASDKTYTSSVTGNFTVSGVNKVTATNTGSATLTVTANDAGKIVGTATRTVSNITVTTLAINGLTDELEINTEYPVTSVFTPSTANYTDVNVVATGNLSFNATTGKVLTTTVGTGTIKITNKSNSAVVFEKTYTIVDSTPVEPEA